MCYLEKWAKKLKTTNKKNYKIEKKINLSPKLENIRKP